MILHGHRKLSVVINVTQEQVGDALTEFVPKRLKTSLRLSVVIGVLRGFQWLLVDVRS